jgi:hypothetical protein
MHRVISVVLDIVCVVGRDLYYGDDVRSKVAFRPCYYCWYLFPFISKIIANRWYDNFIVWVNIGRGTCSVILATL